MQNRRPAQDRNVHFLADLLFRMANYPILLGWVAVAASPESELTPMIVKGIMAYIGLIYIYALLNGKKIEGANFTTLAGVRAIFQRGNDFTLTACWVHYLAFDLGIGFMISQEAISNHIPKMWTWPCLVLTLMLGPSGYLLWSVIRFICGFIY